MKKRILFAASVALLMASSCQSPQQTTPQPEKWWSNATVYEVNTRQFSASGKLTEVEKALPRLKELGVDILWMMPVQPVGALQRKGSLGSYYSIQDYRAINPEFGTMEEFKSLVNRAHELGMKVILDWVANHTSWDAKWMNNEAWYAKDSLGKMYAPYDWTDVAELNYDDATMRQEMLDAMKFWLTETNIDGFRCDMAHEVPTDFWTATNDSLKALKPDIFLLGETEHPDLTKTGGFHANYAWELHHLFNNLATGKADAPALWNLIQKKGFEFGQNEIQLNFITNHDENSWAGTEFERMGDAVNQMAALSFVLPGMPLIYNGQEAGFNRRLAFFEKDSIDWKSLADYTPLYQKLDKLRNDNPALWSGNEGGAIQPIDNNQPTVVFSFKRTKSDNSIIALFNFSNSSVEVTLNDVALEGEFTQFGDGNKVHTQELTLTLPAHGYAIYTK